MTMPRSIQRPPQLWSVPVAFGDIGETGRHFDLVADEATRAAVARAAAVRAVPRLNANFDVARHGAAGLHVTGKVSATVGQTCVVTLEPLLNEVNEDINLVFVLRAGVAEQARTGTELREGPESLVDGAVDLGALATEFLILGLDPYPRKPGVEFQPPQADEAEAGPFAALVALKADLDRDGG